MQKLNKEVGMSNRITNKILIYEAVIFNRNEIDFLKFWLGDDYHSFTAEKRPNGNACLTVKSLGRLVNCAESDYIVRFANGEIMVYSHDDFIEMYGNEI